jgi:putative hydrolase of the HAD superfamily
LPGAQDPPAPDAGEAGPSRERFLGAECAAERALGDRVSRVDTLLFDVTGTLLTVRGSVGRLYAEVAADHGLALDAMRAQRAFELARAAAPPLAFPKLPAERRSAAERDWWQALVAGTFGLAGGRGAEDGDRFEAFFDDLYRRFAKPEAWRVDEDAARVLSALVAQGYLLGVLSNFDSRLPGLLAALGLIEHFGAVATSVSLGAAKPDPRAFDAALAHLGADRRSTAYVGDSPGADAQGAARAGLLPVLLRSDLPKGVAGLRIERLAELLDLFRWPAQPRLRGPRRRPS